MQEKRQKAPYIPTEAVPNPPVPNRAHTEMSRDGQECPEKPTQAPKRIPEPPTTKQERQG